MRKSKCIITFCTFFMLTCTLVGCVDNSFDFDSLDWTMGFGGDNLALPGNSSIKEIMLDDILELKENENVKIDEKTGNYYFELVGTMGKESHPKVDPVEIDVRNKRNDSLLFTFPKVPENLAGRTFTLEELSEYYDIPELKGDFFGFSSREERPADLKDIYEADCSSDVTFIVEFSQSMKDINAYFKTVTVTFPDFIVLNEENKSGAIVDNATHSVTVKNVSARKGATFSTEIVKLVNVDHSVEIPNKKEFVHVAEDSIRMEGDLTAEAVLDRLTLVETEGETDYFVKGRMLIGDVKISRIVGQFSPSIDMNVGSAKVGDIPDFLNDEDVVVDLENPQIRLQLYTDLDISGIVDGDVVARDKQGKELARVHIPKFKMIANGQTNLLLCQQEMQEEGWQTVVVPDLTRLVNKIPSTVDFELSATGNPDDMADIVLGHRYTVSPPSYSIYAPLTFTDKAKIVYTDSLIGWNSDLEDLDLSENAVIKLTADAYSKMPAELKMEVYGLDMNGKRIPDDRLLITVNATIAAAEKEGEEKMTPIELSLEQKDRKVFRELDGIAFKITGGNFLKGRTLNAYKQTIRLDKVKLTMNGRLIADLND